MKYGELNEGKKHGNEGFPIEYYFVDENHPQYEMPLHWHREIEFVYIRSGHLTLHLNALEYHLKQGDIAVINGGVLHRGAPHNCVYECIVCDLNMLRRSADTLTDLILPIISGQMTVSVLFEADFGTVYACAMSLFASMRHPADFFELEVVGRLFSLVCELYRADAVKHHRANRQENLIKRITEMLDWLEDNISEPVSLQKLASIAGLNEKYFCRVFKDTTGRTPVDYINQLRINTACQLLQHETRSITEVAMLCGFSDMCYFSKVFKKYKNLSPRQWLKLNKTQT